MKSISDQIFEALKKPDAASVERAMHKIVMGSANGYNDTMRPFIDHHNKIETSLRPVPTNPATVQALYDIYMENMISEGKYHETLDFEAWQEKRSQIKRLDVDRLPDLGPTRRACSTSGGGTQVWEE